ncbi:MAG TPA: hypothetical protein VGE07_00350, partial [Herpetosiphonaceae bacterium]
WRGRPMTALRLAAGGSPWLSLRLPEGEPAWLLVPPEHWERTRALAEEARSAERAGNLAAEDDLWA